MTFDVEIMLRHDDRVITERIEHAREAADWTEADVEIVLRGILGAIDRVQHPGGHDTPSVSLRGLSWIVNPYKDGVVLAFEIHSASAVAGPFAMPQQRLEALVAAAMRTQQPAPTVH